MGKFIIKTQKDGQFMFNLKASNGEIILTSEAYTTKQNCLNGIESVKENSKNGMIIEESDTTPREDVFKMQKGLFITHNHDGNWGFNLVARNGEIIGRSESYTSRAGMENGIMSIVENAAGAKIEDEC